MKLGLLHKMDLCICAVLTQVKVYLSDIMLFCAYPVPLTCLLMPLLAWVSGGQVLWQAPCHRRIKALTPEALGRSMSCSLAMQHAVSVGGDLASTKFMIELISNSSVTPACAPGDEVLRRPPHDQVAQDAVQGDGPAVRANSICHARLLTLFC